MQEPKVGACCVRPLSVLGIDSQDFLHADAGRVGTESVSKAGRDCEIVGCVSELMVAPNPGIGHLMVSQDVVSLLHTAALDAPLSLLWWMLLSTWLCFKKTSP